MVTPNPFDWRAKIAELQRQIDDLATSAGLGHSSVSRGVLRVLTPEGDELAGAGHAGGKSGLLLKQGSGWVTVQEHVAAERAEIDAYARHTRDIADAAWGMGDSARTRLGGVDSTLGNHASRLAAAEGDIAGLQSGKASVASVNNLQTQINGKASVSALDDLRSDFEHLRNHYYNHTTHPPQKITG